MEWYEALFFLLGMILFFMALGVPGDVTAAIMLGALLIHDVVPSPSFILS